MILVLIAIWMGFLWLLVKIGILKKWHLWMKLSPIAVWAIAMLIIFLPLNWTAPVGAVSVVVESVQVRRLPRYRLALIRPGCPVHPGA